MVKPKKILIVDDSPVERHGLGTKLKCKGYQVLQAEEGALAIGVARRERPDLIVLDVSFPPDVAHGGGVAWDGFLIMNWLRRLEEVKNTPVIFISGLDPQKYRDRAMKGGASGFFHKPYDVEQLLAMIEKELSQQKTKAPSKKRVLFVDDEGDWRFVAAACLEDAGFEVLTAKDAAETLKRSETVKLDGIVLDLNLAGENGLLLMELLKQKHPGVPILFYTGQDHDKESIDSMIKQGAKQYLKKGSMSDLCTTLKAMVN